MKREMTQEEHEEAIEHRDILLDVRAVLTTVSGRNFFKYLFKYFEVGELPPIGLPEEFIREKLGLLRAGQSVFELASEANAEMAGSLLAQKEKDRYAKKYAEQGIGAS